jgi:uncharacterized iron-regulated protein
VQRRLFEFPVPVNNARSKVYLTHMSEKAVCSDAVPPKNPRKQKGVLLILKACCYGRVARALFLCALFLVSAGCAIRSSSPPIDAKQLQLNHAMKSKKIVLLGEVHDNATQHAMRLIAFQNLLVEGKRPALLMEQFDRENQAAIEFARIQFPNDLGELIAAGSPGKQGWNWELYKPFIALAIKYDLPIVAVNVSNKDAMKAMREGLAALDISLSPDLQLKEQQAKEIFNGHCQMMPMESARKMVNAQVAKDIVMAQFVAKYQARGAVLLAGNGHVRKDIGIPVWLSHSARENSVSIGLLEGGSTANLFDVTIITTAPARNDPCLELRK